MIGAHLSLCLEQFLHQSDWSDWSVPKQARSIFTTICIVEHADTDLEDYILSYVYKKIKKDTVTYHDFKNYMCELIS